MQQRSILEEMRMWAIDNHLVDEFDKEIMSSEHLNTWIANNSLIKRFGDFILEYSGIANLRSS